MPPAMDTRRAASRGVVRRPAASCGVVWGWGGTYLPRPSHDDGTFTQGKLPQTIFSRFGGPNFKN